MPEQKPHDPSEPPLVFDYRTGSAGDDWIEIRLGDVRAHTACMPNLCCCCMRATDCRWPVPTYSAVEIRICPSCRRRWRLRHFGIIGMGMLPAIIAGCMSASWTYPVPGLLWFLAGVVATISIHTFFASPVRVKSAWRKGRVRLRFPREDYRMIVRQRLQ